MVNGMVGKENVKGNSSFVGIYINIEAKTRV